MSEREREGGRPGKRREGNEGEGECECVCVREGGGRERESERGRERDEREGKILLTHRLHGSSSHHHSSSLSHDGCEVNRRVQKKELQTRPSQ